MKVAISQLAPDSGAWLSQGFHPNHKAWDVAIPQGTLLRSPGSGTVRYVGTDKHGNSVVSMRFPVLDLIVEFVHLSLIKVKNGQRIDTSTILGRSGGKPGTYGAGKSTGAHLHLQVKKNGRLIDPGKYFTL